MELILSVLVLTSIFYILFLQINTRRKKEQEQGILVRQSPLFSMLASACIVGDSEL